MHEDLKWTHWPVDTPYGWAETWQLNRAGDAVKRGTNGLLYILRYRADTAWSVHVGGHRLLATFPLDTPVEELKARAIAEWRLG